MRRFLQSPNFQRILTAELPRHLFLAVPHMLTLTSNCNRHTDLVMGFKCGFVCRLKKKKPRPTANTRETTICLMEFSETLSLVDKVDYGLTHIMIPVSGIYKCVHAAFTAHVVASTIPVITEQFTAWELLSLHYSTWRLNFIIDAAPWLLCQVLIFHHLSASTFGRFCRPIIVHFTLKRCNFLNCGIKITRGASYEPLISLILTH